MITFVCWKWKDPNSNRDFRAVHVNVLAASIARNYAAPHRFVCVTDDRAGLAPGIEAVPLPRTGLEELINEPRVRYNVRGRPMPTDKYLPSCYRRLWNFSDSARGVLGPRIFAIDIDCIVTGDLLPLVMQKTADFVGWSDARFGWAKIAGGAYIHNTGTRPDVWTDFHPVKSLETVRRAGLSGSDQAWMSYKLFPARETLTSPQLVKLKWTPAHAAAPPPQARLIFTSGESPPWAGEVQRRYPWVARHWKL